jgi:hypothetical protein
MGQCSEEVRNMATDVLTKNTEGFKQARNISGYLESADDFSKSRPMTATVSSLPHSPAPTLPCQLATLGRSVLILSLKALRGKGAVCGVCLPHLLILIVCMCMCICLRRLG